MNVRMPVVIGIAALLASAPAGLTAAEPLASPPAAPAPAPASVQAPAQTLQQRFDAASAAAEAGNCAVALPLFEQLARDPRIKPGSLPAATIAVRRGQCLIATGADADGEELVTAGLPVLEKAGDPFVLDVDQAYLALGKAALLRYDHDHAVAWLGRAAQSTARAVQLDALWQLAMATAFDGDRVAIATADKGLALLQGAGKAADRTVAAFLTVRGRTHMNLGEIDAALADLKRALSLTGGFGVSGVRLDDVSLRSDLAQAWLLKGNKEEARRALAYTGAGRIAQSPFLAAERMDVPECGPEFGLRPEDSAVVEFSIGNDGRVDSALTTYSRGGFTTAAAFAGAVREWAWEPARIAKLPLFYRALVRVELRCSRTGGGLPGPDQPMLGRFAAWAGKILGTAAPQEGTWQQREAALRSLAAAREAAGDRRAAGAALTALVLNDPTTTRARLDAIDRASAMLAGVAPTPADPGVIETLALLRYLRAMAEARLMVSEAAQGQVELRGAKAAAARREAGTKLALALRDPLIAGDPVVGDALLLQIEARPEAKRAIAADVDPVRQVAEDARLPESHPLRQLALLRLANRAAKDGQLQAARDYFTRTGLTEQQCSVLGDLPRMRNTNSGPGAYPMEALMMGFEGWVKVEFDIQADGRTAAPRALIAYPPFVFVDAATGMAKGIRYDSSYRPSGQTACSAHAEFINFVIPSNH